MSKNELARANRDTYLRTRLPITDPLECSEGDRVAYTRYFLRCTGEPPAGQRWHDRGTVTSVQGPLAFILWDGDDEPTPVARTNLAFPTTNSRYAV